jgi:hypothetical protein
VSLVCSASPQENALADFHSALFPVLRALESDYRFEILYVGDSRCAGALARIEALAQLDPRVRLLPQAQPAQGDQALRAGLEEAKGELIITIDSILHPLDMVPQLLEQAKGPCDIVLAVAKDRSAPIWLERLWPVKSAGGDAALLLAKRPAADALRALRDSQRSLRDLAIATGLPRADLPFTPNTHRTGHPAASFRRFAANVLAVCLRDPLGLVRYFGATVFTLGVFLAGWFSLQGLIVPDSVWFSWCYLIVLLHVLGGSTLYALGKLGAMAQQILEHVQPAANQPRDHVPSDDHLAMPIPTRPKHAA